MAIAPRDRHKAEATGKFGIARAYGSYEEHLRNPEIEAIYNLLPNHLHIPWTLKAIEAGKHVLCGKPLSLNAEEAKALLRARDRAGVKVGEAFMVRTHPQWLRTREIINSGRIGALRSVVGFFGYFNRDPANFRNVPEWGGGGLMDIGCYLITISRFVFGEEPSRVLGLIERDSDKKIDHLASVILHFPSGHSIFTCGTQLVYCQRTQFLGAQGRIDVEIPFNAPSDRPCRIFIDNGQDLFGGGPSKEEFAVCNQYTIQGDAFSRAIRERGEVPIPLEDAIKNMSVIDAVFRSGESGKWEVP